MNNGNKGNKTKTVPVYIERIPSPIPAKSLKEVQEISKYFKNLNAPPVNKILSKSYAQASKQASHTEEILKIKDTFPSLKVSKINNIQKIIKGSDKPKPHIKMTTKDPSRKQIIVLINSNNIKRFMNKSSNYIANLNRALKNMRTDVIVNFIHLDLLGIMIITSKVTVTSNLQTIKNYVKTANSINSNSVEVS